MRKKNNDNELVTKVIDLYLYNNIEESNLYIKLLGNQAKLYQTHLQYLEDTKPLFFQRKKLEEHNKKIEECEEKIRDVYLKMEQEINEIEKTQKVISSHSIKFTI